jgi:hypothetical protein
MFKEKDPKFQLVQIATCIAKFIVKSMIKEERNFDLT